jgi:hypothetical protein
VIKGSKYSTIPNSIKIIDKYAFQTSSISSLNIPSSVTTIYASSFRRCSLTSLTIDSANPVYDSRNNCNAVIETTTNTLICGTKKSTIPNTVTTIGAEAFAECTLTSIEIPSSVKTIVTKAFRNCNNLTGVTFAEGLTSMAEMAFYNSKITKVDLPSTLTSVPASAFTSCQYLAEVVLPETMQSIGDAAFQGPSGNNSVKSLTSVTCYATTAPAITNTTFKYQKNNGILRYPLGSASSYKTNWLKNTEGYLGYYGWTGQTLT